MPSAQDAGCNKSYINPKQKWTMDFFRRPPFLLLLLLIGSVQRVRCFAGPRRSPSAPTALRAASNDATVEVPRRDGSAHEIAYRVARPMSLSSRQAAPVVALHGGPSLPSSYLYPLEGAVPYRSIVFYDQLGCGKSDAPRDVSLYSIEDSVNDLKVLLKKLGVRRFHLYGQSYGGILAFEYMKSVASNDEDDAPECLSAVLSSAPTNIQECANEMDRLMEELRQSSDGATGLELGELFRRTYQCRLPEMPGALADAYANPGTVWFGLDAIADYVAEPPPSNASRMPSSLILRGEYDFVSEASVAKWKDVFNTPFLRYKTLEGCSHHGLFESSSVYGDVIDSYFSEYD